MKPPVLLTVPLLALLAVGCVTEKSFGRQGAAISCSQARECDKAEFEALFDNMGECRDFLEEIFEDQADAAEEAGCEFDSSKASGCLSDARKADCDDEISSSDCDEVYDCPEAQE